MLERGAPMSLNLLNFELPQNKQSKYVLTSPKSLRACRRAGIKPVDLLYKSKSDFEKEFGKRGAEAYQEHEKERQRKLGVCRKLRNELLVQGYSPRNSARWKLSSDNCSVVLETIKPISPDSTKGKLTFVHKRLSSPQRPNSALSKPDFPHPSAHRSASIGDKELKRPSSSCRKKLKEKRRTRSLDYQVLLEKIKNEYSNPNYRSTKYERIIENSIDRELRELDVKKTQREIEEGVELWQDEVLTLQWLNAERADEQVSRQLDVKMQRIRSAMRSKEILHTLNINKVKQADDMKADFLRRVVRNKENKIQTLQEDRERLIAESKSRAQTISDIKEQIRGIMTPETFDIKVVKAGIQRKIVCNFPPMCPRTMQNSHIRLG